KPDQAGCDTIPKHLMPRQRPSRTLLSQARTQRHIGPSLNDWSQEKWQLFWSIAVIAVEEYDNVRATRIRQPSQTRAAVSAARFVEDAGSHLGRNLGSPVG